MRNAPKPSTLSAHPPFRRRRLLLAAGAVASALLIGGPGIVPAFTAPGPASANPAVAPEAPASIDTSEWQTFDKYGIAFDYPADWEILRYTCDGCEVDDPPLPENEYTPWNIVDENGVRVAHVFPNFVGDTDGDMGLYSRTDLDTAAAQGIGYEPTSLVFEHVRIDYSQASVTGTERKAQQAKLMLSSDANLATRDQYPFLPYFHPRAGAATWIQTTPEFMETGGMDQNHVTKGEARQFMDSESYRTMKQVMLSVRAGSF
ncbi:hypothetical protein ACIPVK_15675 [Paeniglutamicibacter sp. MACA_103]|uniref:hypothetical protein n=1 Tax=Paeniglutamicibacter sp. MACA_103 TaxID=3377337 RepID=UPI00389387DC